MNKRIGLAGIGKLGTALMTQWSKKGIAIGVYHPDKTKAEYFLESFPNGFLLIENELSNVDVFILALPAMEVVPFISTLITQNPTQQSPTIINMATNLPTKDIKSKFPNLNIYGVKYMGHWKDLLEHGNGLFISESDLPLNIKELFEVLGNVKVDRENCLTEVNKLATYFALKTAIAIETEFAARSISPEYLKRALTSLAPEVIRSYSEGSLGHFAKEIVKEIQAENPSDHLKS
ncbi:NAD(P)-binding domain-containing protein [Neobacillus drentensis]|uniref:NAD(P)-binding domain-containing protein n=1 Tax=Neobacillus drentensis TaxID=220684 RepID=UPI00285F820F|nr:NAD(P)-binding domain-containing protein [Neobacillus drentensis]MDR7236867.1 pyrroline-5-carboxylate reductase [Neobacillus drentensis]